MKAMLRWIFPLMLLLPLWFVTPALAQCEAHVLAALDESSFSPMQRFMVSVWTNDVHCPVSGTVHFSSVPPGAVYEYIMDSFFDVFTELSTLRPGVHADPAFPPYEPFHLVADIVFDDPAFPPRHVEEPVIKNGAGRLEIFRPAGPCLGAPLPPEMMPGMSMCFNVCHGIYHVPLHTEPWQGEPLIRVLPGCDPPCASSGCMPGAPHDYRCEVLRVGEQWVLEFEYSNPMMEPACYCVTYAGNLPVGYVVHTLGAMDEHSQTYVVSLTPEADYSGCGSIDVFSYPPGAYIECPLPDCQFEFHGSEGRTWRIPAGRGSFLPGQTFQLIAHFNYGSSTCPDYHNQWVVEDVMVTPEGGLQALDTGGECIAGGEPPLVPPVLNLGQPECIRVCHDIYHIPLQFPGPGIPQVRVWEGCEPPGPCMPIPGCVPGLPWEYRYEVFRVGGTWMLEFEHSNPLHEPVCYCLEFYNVTPVPVEPYALAALDEARQTFNLGIRSSDCMSPVSGMVTITTNPPGKLDPDWWVESFFDVFCLPHTWEWPVQPAAGVAPGENFQIVVEADYFGPGSDPFDGIVYAENVVVAPHGGLAYWDPVSPCTGDNVPPNMVPGQSACFEVCHQIYEVVLNYNPGGGRPAISVVPGCNGMPDDHCAPHPCVPGGPGDFVYIVYHNGVDWMLRFEYSNPYIEPVCYCVTYEGNAPFDCETFELAALDEGHQNFDVSLRTFSHEGHDCPASGMIQVFSIPEGGYIGPYFGPFTGVGAEWHSMEIEVGPGTFPAGQIFQLVAWINYGDPPYPDRWLTEDVIVSPSGEHLWIYDAGDECTEEDVPPAMLSGDAYCFKVCHRIYHIMLPDATDPAVPPMVAVTPGCIGPPHDPCLPHPECMPGGPFDYRYDLRWVGEYWELEFEYSNEIIEPVCYCVSVAAAQPPCRTEVLTAFDAENQVLKASLRSFDPAGLEPCPVSGIISLSSIPPGVYFENPLLPFANVTNEWVTMGKPTAPEPYNPRRATILLNVNFDDPNQPDMTLTEEVDLWPGGGFVIDDAGAECAAGGGPQIPAAIETGQPECLIVCHDIYYIPLIVPPLTRPLVTVLPGCGPGTPCSNPVPCTPGGPADFRYDVFRVGGTWILEFEYSNPHIEPVCYCVEISAVQDVPYEAYLLATLDETNQTFDVTLWTSPGAPIGSGMLHVHAQPDMTVVLPFDVSSEYVTWEIPAIGSGLEPGESFGMLARAEFVDPVFGVLHYTETAMQTAAGDLMRWDPVTPCIGDFVPAAMNYGDSECFVVCHRIYDILLLNLPGDVPPNLTITPGCFGPPHDDCPPPAFCRPGGPNDYCYRFWFDGVHWHLVFEYSNPYKEPVCYCVTIGEPPCDPVDDLVIYFNNSDLQLPQIELFWDAPETGLYHIYSTPLPNNPAPPPGPGWTLEATVPFMAGDPAAWSQPLPPGPLNWYRNYIVIVECRAPDLRHIPGHHQFR